MASTHLITNQFECNYEGLREDERAYKMALDDAMDALDRANQAIRASSNMKLHRDILHAKYCMSLYKDEEINP